MPCAIPAAVAAAIYMALEQYNVPLSYARYGDIFGEACRMLRPEAELSKVTGWSGLSQRYQELWQ